MEIKFINIGAGKTKGVALDESIADYLQSLSDMDEVFSLSGAVLLKDSRTTRAAKVEIDTDGKRKKLHIKRLNNRGINFTLRYLLDRSRAKRLFYKSIKALELGIPVPHPVAYVEERSFRILKRSYFITETIENTVTFAEFWGSIKSFQQRTKTTQLLADFIANLHEKGYYQRDMKASNILVVKEENGLKFYITDLDGAKIFSKVDYNHRVRDIARLSSAMLLRATKTDRHRFLLKYTESSGISKNNILRLSRDVVTRSIAIVERELGKRKYDTQTESLMRKYQSLYPIRWRR
ncbi:MAG: lipopolysaccharide kinase InaA family protein [Planctomycetota bacterium]